MARQTMTLAAALAALFPISQKAISEKLTQEEFNAFATEAQETQNRLDAQADGNEAVAADLATANATLATTQTELTTAQNSLTTAQDQLKAANDTIAELTPKATAWDAHKKALNDAHGDDGTNKGGKGKPEAGSNLTDKEQARIAENQRLKALYPGLTAGLDIPDATNE